MSYRGFWNWETRLLSVGLNISILLENCAQPFVRVDPFLPRAEITGNSNTMVADFHKEILAAPTRALLEKLTPLPWISDYYLAGGTGLALQLGHRISVDLDFFSPLDFDEQRLIETISQVGQLEVLQKSLHSVTGTLDGVKFSFLGYKYPSLNRTEFFQGIDIASVEDIACMKLDALSSRGTKRDFIDVYFIAKHLPLSELLYLFEKKYAAIRYNLIHVKKSLVYFDDAEADPMPGMILPVTWHEVKDFFIKEAMRL